MFQPEDEQSKIMISSHEQDGLIVENIICTTKSHNNGPKLLVNREGPLRLGICN